MNRIRQLRKQKKLSGKELGEILGYAESTILQWERGVRQPDMNSLVSLANFFNVSTDYLLNRTDYEKVIKVIDEYEKETLTTVNLLESYPKSVEEVINSHSTSKVQVPVKLVGNNNFTFALSCNDEKMSPSIENGDILIMTTSIDVSSCDIVLVNTNSKVFLARISYFKDVIVFSFDKAGSKVLVVDKNDVNIIAKVVEIRRKF
jgi:transcriptional regulator with XRE-family HTH domain